MKKSHISRRGFLAAGSAGLAVPSLFHSTLQPKVFAADSPSERVRFAAVGVGGKGWTDLNGAAKHADLVAYCDVDQSKNGRRGGYAVTAKQWPKARGYSDWREMLDKEQGKIDAVTVSTPDHMHAPVTFAALQLALATYTQKPLTRTIGEARQLTLAAAKAGVSTQMGNQHHSGIGYRTLVSWVQSGLLGKIKTAHTWSNRPIWPQGIDRPKGEDPIPKGFNWDLWLGVAEERPYLKDVYHPFKWRGWYDFGAGALGDMGCHIIDPVVWSLELGPASKVRYEGPKPNSETFPGQERLHYTFAGTKHCAAETFKMTWHDGGLKPDPKDCGLPAKTKLPDNGLLMIGEKASLVCSHGRMPEIITDGITIPEYKPILKKDHYEEWISCIRTGKNPGSYFGYAGPLTETVLLGVVASRVEAKELLWDSEAMRFTNSEDANRFVEAEYRTGWQQKTHSPS